MMVELIKRSGGFWLCNIFFFEKYDFVLFEGYYYDFFEFYFLFFSRRNLKEVVDGNICDDIDVF